MKDIFNCSNTGELVASAKEACSIIKPNSEMSDGEIRTIVYWIFEQLPDTSWVNERIVPSRAGIDLLLFVTMSEFPEFYQRYGLGQYN